MVTAIMLMHSQLMELSGTTLMETATAITRMELRAIGSLTTLTDGKILTKMVTLMKMMHSSMMQHNGMILMVTAMAMRLTAIEQMNSLMTH